MTRALEEIGQVNLGDKRLEARAITLLNDLGSKPLETIPVACQRWAETKAAYRFFDPTFLDLWIYFCNFAILGQRHEMSQAEALIKGISKTIVIGDKGYDSNAFVEILKTKECLCVIPSKRNRLNPRNYDAHLYKERHLIECFFGKIKHFRRIFSRFDKTAASFLAFLHFVSALIWLR